MRRGHALETNGLGHAELQEFTQDNKLLIRVKASTTIEEKIAERVMAVFGKEFPEQQVRGGLQHWKLVRPSERSSKKMR